MKRWPLSVFVFLLVATALLLAGVAVAQTPCDTADKLFNASLYDDAKANYKDLLTQYQTLDCAQVGMQRAEAGNLYEQGLAYEKANQVDAAKGAYVKALEKDPNFSNATEALARMNGGVLRNKLNSIYNWLSNWLLPPVEFVAVILIFILFSYALRWRIFPWIMGSSKPRLDILDFDKGATTLEIGKGMAAMVEEEIIWFQKERHPHHGIKVVSGPINKLEIPVDIKSVPQIKILSDMIGWLFPPNVITLSGFLEKQGDQGVGLTLSLAKSQTGEIIASQTLWQEEYDPAMKQSTAKDNDPEPYYHLAEPIATWTVFQLGTSPKVKNGTLFKLLGPICSYIHRFAPCEKYLIKRADEFKILNTNSWLSYAYFRAGVRWELENKTDIARKMYLKALKEDPNNIGALLNLGSRYSKDEDYQRTLKILERVKELTNPDNPENGFTWYTYKYRLAIAYHYIAKKYNEYMDEAFKKVKEINEIIEKSNEAKNQCNLHKAGEYADILVEKIKKAKENAETGLEDILVDAKKLETVTSKLGDILYEAKKFRETIYALKKNGSNASTEELSNAKSSAKTLLKSIGEMKENNVVFDCSMEKAEKEANELVERIQKEIRELPLELENESKKLLEIMTEAIYELQNNKDKAKACIERAKGQAKILEDSIIKANDALQNTKNKSLKCYLNESKDLAIAITISRILNIENIGLEDRLNKAKEVVEKLDRKIRLSVNELKQGEKYSLKLSLNKFEPMAICVWEEILAEMDGKVSEKPFKRKKPSEYDPGFQYNKACYYSVAGEKKKDENELDKALLHLKYAIEQDSTKAEWAQKDPSLKGVRDDEKTKAEFNEIIKKYGGPQNLVVVDSLPLAGIAIIGEAYAKQLKENEIESYCDLILKADTHQAQEALAKKLGINTTLMRRWVHLADIMRIVGNTQQINLLEEAGVGSLKALQNVSDPCELANLLNQINKAMSLVSQTPSIETIRQWVQEAKKTGLKVH